MTVDKLILWKPLYKTTMVLYVLVFLLALPAPKVATLLLFAIIAIWSRVPALMTQFTKDVEVVDFTAVVITIYMGPFIGAIFGSGIILFTRLFGPTEPIDYTIRDAICFFIGAFVVAAMFKITGGNVLITMFSMTFVRYTVYPILGFIFNPGALFLDIVILSVSIPIAIISNLLLVQIFGDSFDEIFAQGAVLNWKLLIFVTIVVGVIFVLSKFLDKEEEKRMIHEEKTQYYVKQDGPLDLGMVGSLAHAPEPHESFFILHDIQDQPSLLKSTRKLFNGMLTTIIFTIVAVINYQQGKINSVFDYIILAIGIYAIVQLTYNVIHKYFVKKKRQNSANTLY